MMDDFTDQFDNISPNSKNASSNGKQDSVIDLASLDDSGSNHSDAGGGQLFSDNSGDDFFQSPVPKFSRVDPNDVLTPSSLTDIRDSSYDEDGIDNASIKEPPPFDLPDQIEFYRQGDHALPIYSKGKKRFASGNSFTAVETLLFVYNEEQQYLAKHKPVRIFQNLTFIVDLTSLRSVEDWKADDVGIWVQGKTYTTWWRVDSLGQISPVGTQRSRGDLADATHVLIMRPYTHSQASDYHRVVYTLRPNGGSDFVAAIQYTFDGSEHEIVASFSRTEPSIFKELRAIVSSTGPKKATSIVSTQRGGLVGASSSAQLPRGERQAKYVASTLKASSDPWVAVTLLAKSQSDWVRSFDIRDGVPSVSLFNNRQLQPATVTAILRDLFGDDKHEGIIHSASLEEYSERLESLLPKWDSLQKEDNSSSLFSAWYKTHKDKLYQARMLYKVLDSTLTAPFTTNGAEAVNCYVKDWLDGQRKGNVDVSELIKQLAQLVQQQEECMLAAFLGEGKWRLKPDYEDAQLSKQSWFSASQQIRTSLLHKMLRANASNVTNAAKAFAKACQTASIENVVTAERGDADISSLEMHLTPGHVSILREAAASIAGKITQPDSYLFWVPSGRASSKLPFVVEQNPAKATFQCDKACTTFKGIGVCEHLLAVGLQFNRLSEILAQFHEKKKKSGMLNASSALTCDLPRAGTKQSSCHVQGPKRKRIAHPAAKAPLPPILQRAVDFPDGADRPSTSAAKSPEQQSYPFSVVLLPANVTKCFGCERSFADKYRKAPYNCILRHLDKRPVYKHGMKTGTTSLAPAYYHLNAECVRRKEFLFQPKAYYSEQKIVIFEEVRDALSEQQWHVLNKFCSAQK